MRRASHSWNGTLQSHMNRELDEFRKPLHIASVSNPPGCTEEGWVEGILYHSNLLPFLDTKTIIELSRASKSVRSLVEPFISSNFVIDIGSSPVIYFKNMEKIKIIDYQIPNLSSFHFPKINHLCFYSTNSFYVHNCTYYTLHLCRNHPISPEFISSLQQLTHLKIDNCCVHLQGELFPNLTHLICPPSRHTQYIDNLAPLLKRLHLSHLDPTSTPNLAPPLTHFIASFNFNQPIEKLPKTLIFLQLDREFSGPLDNLPPGLKYFGLCGGEEFSFSLDSLPNAITHFFLDRPVKNRIVLPQNLTHLCLSTPDNYSVDILPPTIKRLIFPYGYDFEISNLPALKHLTHLLGKFNYPQCGLPLSLKVLKLHNFSNCTSLLPPNITHLILEQSSTKFGPILPSGITYLRFGNNFNLPISGSLPPHVTYLEFGGDFNQPLDCLPSSIIYLIFGLDSNYVSIFNQPMDMLPPNIEVIKFGEVFNQKVDNLPPKLRYLCFGGDFDQNVDSLPSNLQELHLGYQFNQCVDKLPPKLTKLTFGNAFNQSADNLPQNLLHLEFGDEFNQPVDNLPPRLLHLRFGSSFNQPVTRLPPTTAYLTFGANFNQSVDNQLPSGLTYLHFKGGNEQPEKYSSVPFFGDRYY